MPCARPRFNFWPWTYKAHGGPCNSVEPPSRVENRGRPARSSGQQGKKDGLRLGPETSRSVADLPAPGAAGLLGQILLPLMLPPALFIYYCIVLFCILQVREGGCAPRLAELSVRAFEVGAQGWGACCVRSRRRGGEYRDSH